MSDQRFPKADDICRCGKPAYAHGGLTGAGDFGAACGAFMSPALAATQSAAAPTAERAAAALAPGWVYLGEESAAFCASGCKVPVRFINRYGYAYCAHCAALAGAFETAVPEPAPPATIGQKFIRNGFEYTAYGSNAVTRTPLPSPWGPAFTAENAPLESDQKLTRGAMAATISVPATSFREVPMPTEAPGTAPEDPVGWLRIYDGVQPATADAPVTHGHTLLLEMPLTAVRLGMADGWKFKPDIKPGVHAADATGSASWFRVTVGGEAVFDSNEVGALLGTRSICTAMEFIVEPAPTAGAADTSVGRLQGPVGAFQAAASPAPHEPRCGKPLAAWNQAGGNFECYPAIGGAPDDPEAPYYCTPACRDSVPVTASHPEHPAPWRWERDGRYRLDWLVDANDARVLTAGVDYDDDVQTGMVVKSPLARELIRRAPELEAKLRDLEWSGSFATDNGNACCPNCRADAERPNARHNDDCALATILAALDAARAVKS